MAAKRNVEIKAYAKNVTKILEFAKILSESEGVKIEQDDTFYKNSKGRLKLRKFENGNGELIFYVRPDTNGPKLSSYEKAEIAGPNVPIINQILGTVLGASGVVKKTRHLFLCGQTRIHVDSVEGLGDFVELEVCLEETQTPEEGEEIALGIMKSLNVDEEDFICGSYSDLLKNKSI